MELSPHAGPDKLAATPDATFRFFAEKFINYGVGFGAVYGTIIGFFYFIVGALFGAPIGAVVGLILGIPDGIVLGFYAAHLIRKDYSVEQVGRKTCAVAPRATAFTGALIMWLYHLLTHGPLGDLRNWFILTYCAAVFGSYHAGIVASQKFMDKYA